MSVKARFWIAGLMVVSVGIIMAKIISPRMANQPAWQLGLFAGGVLVAIAGLGIILAGLKKN
jgi:hypothetical protein